MRGQSVGVWALGLVRVQLVTEEMVLAVLKCCIMTVQIVWVF